MNTTDYILFVLTGIILVLLLYPVLFAVVSWLFGRDPKKEQARNGELFISCIITGYKNPSIPRPLIKALLAQQYENFEVIAIFDHCDPSEVPSFSSDKYKPIVPEIPFNSKVKSMRAGHDAMATTSEFAIVFDADNLVDARFLSNVNHTLHSWQTEMLQVQRWPKNLDSFHACLDAASEIFKNYIVRYIPDRLGVSAAVSGSGMVMSKTIFHSFVYDDYFSERIDQVIAGEDKVLQQILLEKKVHTAFDRDILLYDEKVSEGYQVRRQRGRWFLTYLESIGPMLRLLFRNILHPARFFFVLNMLYPPLVMLSMLIVVTSIVFLVFKPYLMLPVIGAGLLFVINFIVGLKVMHADPKVFKSLRYVPVFILNQLASMLNISKAKKDFLATENRKEIYIEDVDPRD